MNETHLSSVPDARALMFGARQALLQAPHWQDYVRSVYAIDPGDYPFLTYVGLNFTKTTIKNFKFYFSFYRRLSESEIETLLPVPDRGLFDELYPKWHPSRSYGTIHRGTTFALKVDTQGKLTHYYHLRVPGLLMGAPKRLNLAACDEPNYHGVCEEFCGGQRALKRYYYCRDRGTIADALEQAGLRDGLDDLSQIDWLEYVESQHRDKLTWITPRQDLLRDLIERRGPERLGSALHKICRDCGFHLYGPGSARDLGDHSIYFVQPSAQQGRAGYLFDGVRRFMDRHLQLPGWR